MTRIRKTAIEFEREPLLRPFGFKGGYLSELWQAVSLLESEGGADGIGVGTQSVLWSDANVFSSCSESAGNAYMFAISCHALQLARGLSFDTPLDLLEQILPQAWEYGRAVTGRSDLRQTFVLNAGVSVESFQWENNMIKAEGTELACLEFIIGLNAHTCWMSCRSSSPISGTIFSS